MTPRSQRGEPRSTPWHYLLPRWTRRVATDSSGRDPLGLSRVASLIADYLLSGIVVATDRARYYSFYCWALWHLEREERPKKYADFVSGLRKRDAVLALSTLANDPRSSPVGVTAVKAQWKQGLQRGVFDCDFRILPSNPLGNYGQYYSGSLYNLALTQRSEDGMDHVTEGVATKLALLFHSNLSATPYIRRELFRETEIGLKELQRTAPYLSIDAITQPSTQSERRELLDLFLGFSTHPITERHLLRRHTLAHILHVIHEYGRHGLPSSRQELEWYLVYPVYYYDILWPTSDRTIPYSPPAAFAMCHLLWRQFCLQQFITQALERLLWSSLEILGGHHDGLALAEVTELLLSPTFFQRLKHLVKKSCDSPSKLLAAWGIHSRPTPNTADKLRQTIPVRHPASEAAILREDLRTPPEEAAGAVVLLSVMYGRWRASNDPAFAYVSFHAGEDLWAGNLLPALDSWLEPATSWRTALTDLFSTFVLDQHDRVMYQKGRLESCWLRRHEGLVLKEQDYEPNFRSSRHTSAVGILLDLRLMRRDEQGRLHLTAEGLKLLHRLLQGDRGSDVARHHQRVERSVHRVLRPAERG